MHKLKKGDRVRLKQDTDLAIWSIKKNDGIVLDTKSYGLFESMVTVDFAGRRVHISDMYLSAISD
jgi:hypothetical protein